MDGWALIEVGFVTTFFLFKGHTLVLQNIDCWFRIDPLKLRVKISAALTPKKKKKKLIFFCIMGFLAPAGPARYVWFTWGARCLTMADAASSWQTEPAGPVARNTSAVAENRSSIAISPPRSLLSGAYRLKQRLRHFVEELRLRYVHSLSHLSATDDPQYAGVPTGEIKLPDTRLHHCPAPARRTAGRRVFNHACFTGPPRLVKSWWPLMTKGIAGVMKRNGPRGEGIGGRWSSRWGRWRCNCREEIGTLSNERKGWKKGEGGAFPSGRGLSEAGAKSEFPSCDDHYMFLYNVQGCRHFTSRHSEITFSPPRMAVSSSSFVLRWVQFDASMLSLQSHAKEKC